MVDSFSCFYMGMLVLYKLTENFFLYKIGAAARKPARDWTMWMLVAAFLLVIAAPLGEHFYFRTSPSAWEMLAGAFLLLAGTAVRARGLIDLGKNFSMAIEKLPGHSLVEKGLYRCVRHPLYLGNILLFLACPLMLGGRWSWLATAGGMAVVLWRLKIEERFLIEHLPGYRDYMRRTWRLIPWVY